jgi:hypothetical protein
MGAFDKALDDVLINRADPVPVPFKIVDVWIGPPEYPRDRFFALLNMPGAE